MLPKEAVLEWKQIYKKQTSEDISMQEATVRANKMFRFLKLITSPTQKKEVKHG